VARPCWSVGPWVQPDHKRLPHHPAVAPLAAAAPPAATSAAAAAVPAAAAAAAAPNAPTNDDHLQLRYPDDDAADAADASRDKHDDSNHDRADADDNDDDDNNMVRPSLLASQFTCSHSQHRGEAAGHKR